MPDWMDAAMLAFKSNQKLALKQYCLPNTGVYIDL